MEAVEELLNGSCVGRGRRGDASSKIRFLQEEKKITLHQKSEKLNGSAVLITTQCFCLVLVLVIVVRCFFVLVFVLLPPPSSTPLFLSRPTRQKGWCRGWKEEEGSRGYRRGKEGRRNRGQ